MKRTVVAVVLSGLLLGCTAAVAETPAQWCEQAGYQPGTELFLQCVSLASADQVQRIQQQQNAWRALQQWGEFEQQLAQPRYCYRVGFSGEVVCR